MNAIFLKVIELSIAAACIVVVILALRLLLHRRAPKWVMCALWILVAVRLVFPFTIESVLSMQPDIDDIKTSITDTLNSQNAVGNGGQGVVKPGSNATIIQPGSSSAVTNPDNNATVIQPGDSTMVDPEVEHDVNPDKGIDWLNVATMVWVVGMCAMVGYAIGSVLVLRMSLTESTLMEKGIRQNGSMDSPFVLGVFKPTIYLPYSLSQRDRDFVIAHERTHISRGDHLWKPFGYLLLSFHWFNPLLWVAYVILCRDIEAACDEKVISQYTKEERQAYSLTLLNCSCKRKRITACPVAFGEVGVKERIKGVMNYKKPSFWIVIVAILAAIAVAVTFLTSPPKGSEEVPSPTPTASPTATPTATPKPTVTPTPVSYDVPPVKMEVAEMHLDSVKVQLFADGEIKGARAFANGPVEVKHLVNGFWEPFDSAYITSDALLILYENLTESKLFNISLTLPARFEDGHTYQISIPLITDRDPSKGKEYSVSVEFVYMPTVYSGVYGIKTELENIPSNYSAEESVVEGGFRLVNGSLTMYGKPIEWAGYKSFMDLICLVKAGVSCEMRFTTSYGSYLGDIYRYHFNDIVFDGTKYTIRTLIDRENKIIESHEYAYLIRYDGPKETPEAEYDYYERYVLTNSPDVTWEDILAGRYTDYFILGGYLTIYPETPEINKDISKITLEYKGEIISEINSENTCNFIREILSKAKRHNMEAYCSCGWYTVDTELVMTLWYEDGEKLIINPIRSQPVVVIGENHYEYQYLFLAYFGLSEWPN